jgi:peptide/nickel transport system substrate-binding protein
MAFIKLSAKRLADTTRWLPNLFLFAASFGCSTQATQPSVDVTHSITLTIGLPVQTGQDPLHGAVQASRLISREGLTLPNRDGHAQPRLAETWTESPDGLTWRFKLRPNAYFHDNSQVDAGAVKASRSLATSDIDQFPGLADIVGIEAPNPSEVLIRLRARSTFLLDDLGVSILKTAPGVPAIGAGPYQLHTTSENELVMHAFKNYYKGVPQIERIVWKSYPTIRTAWAAMMRGEIDFLYEIGPEAKEFIEPESSVRSSGSPSGAQLRGQPRHNRKTNLTRSGSCVHRTDVAVALGARRVRSELCFRTIAVCSVT